jgi:hypothetical protein
MRINTSCRKSLDRDYGLIEWQNVCCLTVVTFLFVVFGCSNHLGNDNEVTDTQETIAAEVKVALVQESELNAAPIDVKVNQNVVTLGGFVEEESQRQQAAQAARRVKGVESVINNIQVK